MDWEDAVTELQVIALQIIRSNHPHGVDEMTLMDELDAAGLELFEKPRRLQPERLFRAHFILFHSLYRLRPELAAQGLELDIHCLEINLRQRATIDPSSDPSNHSHSHPYSHPSHGALDEPDKVAAYYLDPSNLEGMDDAAVEQLITDGLRRCLGEVPNLTSCPDRRLKALATLGLEEDADKEQIRAAYRRLAMRHHPDRGGDTATLQQINEAYRLLTNL